MCSMAHLTVGDVERLLNAALQPVIERLDVLGGRMSNMEEHMTNMEHRTGRMEALQRNS